MPPDFCGYRVWPAACPLMQLLKTRGLAPTIICESAGTQAEDAAALKKLYEQG